MKIIYIFTPVHPKSDTIGMRWVPPLAVYYLANIMKENGIDVTIIDPQMIRESKYFHSEDEANNFVSDILKDGYDAALFSSTTGNWGITKGFIEKIHNIKPDLKIVVGGIHASYFDEYILKSNPVDVAIRGEGEYSLIDVLKNLNNKEQLRSIKGIAYKDNGEIIKTENRELLTVEELMSMPEVDYRNVPKDTYTFFGVETSRGCKFNCIFCSVCHRSSWRGFEADFVVDRIQRQFESIEKNGLSAGTVKFFFVDDCFTADQDRALEILKKLHENKPSFKIGFEARVTDLIKPGFIESLPGDMIDMVQVGVEAGYNEGLRKVRKGITVEQLEECVQLLSDSNLQYNVSLSFIIGFPWEDIEDIKKTINTIVYLCGTYGIGANLNWLWMMPSDLWFERKKYGIMVEEDAFDNPLWIASKEYFLKTHPKLTMEDIKSINEIVLQYIKKGINFGFTGVNFDLD